MEKKIELEEIIESLDDFEPLIFATIAYKPMALTVRAGTNKRLIEHVFKNDFDIDKSQIYELVEKYLEPAMNDLAKSLTKLMLDSINKKYTDGKVTAKVISITDMKDEEE